MELVPLLTEDPDVQWDEELVEGFLSQVTETATGILDLSLQVKELKEMMDESVRKQTLEVQEKEKDSDFKQSLEAQLLILVMGMQTKEVVAELKEQQRLSKDSMDKKHEEIKREVRVRTERLEEREKVLSLLNENVQDRCNELEKREEEFRVIRDAEAKDVEVKRKELEAREKEREEEFKLKQDSEAKEIEVKMRSLELKEKELGEREALLRRKEKEFEERSKQGENRKRWRESSLFAENDRDEDPPLIHTAKRHKPIRGRETNLDCGLYGKTSYDIASASASEANGREVYEEVECIDDGEDEDPEPYNCLDADFNNFNNTMSSFSVGQVWALYDPLDHMPRFYALITKILELQLRVEVTWLEPIQSSESHKPAPIACGEFKYGDKTTRTHLMFSHLMLDHHIRTRGKKKRTITINPRKGETWALFRDWNRDKQQKRPYSYNFVKVVSELDSVHGIGVAYLGRVEGFTSVYQFAEKNKVLQKLIPCDEMLRFSHRVPSFALNGDEEEGVPGGSFELDPAAIPRDYLEGLKVKEKEEEGIGRSLVVLV